MLRSFIASRASTEHTRCWVAGSCRGGQFQWNFSDERQRSGRIKAVGHWFKSGRCVGALTGDQQPCFLKPQRGILFALLGCDNVWSKQTFDGDFADYSLIWVFPLLVFVFKGKKQLVSRVAQIKGHYLLLSMKTHVYRALTKYLKTEGFNSEVSESALQMTQRGNN